jgi:hypothetical protein
MAIDANRSVNDHIAVTDSIGTRIIVWGTLVVMLIAALSFVALYGSNVPYRDDWDIVPTMTGHQPITVEWLWSQHNEHRVPVPRIIGLVLYWIFGMDFRVGMYFNVITVACLAFTMILVAKRLRQRLEYSDAFFPLLLLNWGQGLNFIWSWQIEFFLSTALTGIVLMLIVYLRIRLTVRSAILIGMCLLLLAMCGAHGVALLPAIGVWIASAGINYMRSGVRWGRRDGGLILCVAVLMLLFVWLYFVGYQKVPYHPKSSGLKTIVKTAIQFLTMGLGPAVRGWWPFSGLAASLLLTLSVALLLIRFWKVAAERTRTLGLIFFIGAMACLGLGIGLGRDGFEPRYITLSVPVWCCIYYIGVICTSLKVGRALQVVLVILAVFALPQNMKFGLDYAIELRTRFAALEHKMVAGTPAHELISAYGEDLHPHHEIPTDYMPMLQQAGIGSFRYLKKEPLFREVKLPLVPVQLNQVKWVDGTAYATGNAPYLVFNLPVEQYLAGVRVKFTYTSQAFNDYSYAGACPYVGLYWKRFDQSEFSSRQFQKYNPTGDKANWCKATWKRLNDPDVTMSVWICDRVGQLRINPDFKPGVFTIHEIVLLYPLVK